MKKSVSFLLLLSLFCISFAQDPAAKANTIIITDTLSAQSYWKIVSALLIENGFGIQSADKETGTISTLPRSFKNGDSRFNLLIQDKRIVIRGDLTTGIGIDYGSVSSGASWYMIENKGGKGSPYNNAWNELFKFAELIPGKKEYLVK